MIHTIKSNKIKYEFLQKTNKKIQSRDLDNFLVCFGLGVIRGQIHVGSGCARDTYYVINISYETEWTENCVANCVANKVLRASVMRVLKWKFLEKNN